MTGFTEKLNRLPNEQRRYILQTLPSHFALAGQLRKLHQLWRRMISYIRCLRNWATFIADYVERVSKLPLHPFASMQLPDAHST
jgi:hypothetical protein